mgnify:CR=1 FL=1
MWAFDEAYLPIAAIHHGTPLLISPDVLAGPEVTRYRSPAMDIQNAGVTDVNEAVGWDGNSDISRVPSDLPASLGQIDAPQGV